MNFLYRVHKIYGQHSYKTENSANGKGERKIAQITKFSAQYGEDNPAHCVGKKNPAVILPEVFISKNIGGNGWKQGKQPAIVKSN